MEKFQELSSKALASEVDFTSADESAKYRGLLVGEGYFESQAEIDEYYAIVKENIASTILDDVVNG